MTREKIERINELYRKSKTAAGLTPQEKTEQARLRDEYRKGVVSNLKGQLANIEFTDEKGRGV